MTKNEYIKIHMIAGIITLMTLIAMTNYDRL